MSFRITTNGLFRNYRTNLSNSNKKLNDTMTNVQTQRKFNTYADDPAAASKTFQIRRSLWRNDNQITNTNHLISKFETAWGAVDTIVEGDGDGDGGLNGLTASLRALTGTAGPSRVTLGQEMVSTAKSMVQVMNVKYGDEFIFAGADGLNVPLEWSDDGTKLLYRGVDVTGGDTSTLEAMAGETTYVDIGLGLKEDDHGDIIRSSAYDSALSALNFMDYGVDDDGDPKNIAVLLHELGSIFKNCDSKTGDYNSAEDKETAERLSQKLNDAIDRMQERHVELSAKTKYLTTNLEQLKTTATTLNEQRAEIEDMDPAEAITQMLWAQYSYNAALRIGNQILSQSLLDYMR